LDSPHNGNLIEAERFTQRSGGRHAEATKSGGANATR